MFLKIHRSPRSSECWQEEELAAAALGEQDLSKGRHISFGGGSISQSLLQTVPCKASQNERCCSGCALPVRTTNNGLPKEENVPALDTKGITVGWETGGQGFYGCLNSRLGSSSFVSLQQQAPCWVPCHPLEWRPVTDESLFGLASGLKLSQQHLCTYRQRRQCRKALGKGLGRQSAEQKIKRKKRQRVQ